MSGSSAGVERVDFSLNGIAVSPEVAPDERLLTTLRERLGALDVKDGCSPQGQCGCCTVLIDGSPRVACATPTRRVAGRTVVTPRGLRGSDPEVANALATAFDECGASQCGFCSPGIAVRCAWLLRRSPGLDPMRAEIDRALAAHICRCTGWEPIRDAVGLAAARLRAPKAGKVSEAASTPHISLALGDRPYVDDYRAAGAVFASVVLAPGPGRLRAPLTAEPGTLLVQLAAEAAHDGVILGLVGADSRDRALALAEAAVAGDTWVATGAPIEPSIEGASFHLAPAHPGFLEPEAVLVTGVKVYTSCERPVRLDDGDHAAAVPVVDGGAFGGRREPWLERLAEKAAREWDRPVVLTLTREQSLRAGPARHAARGAITLDGTDLNGSLTFIAGERSLCATDVIAMARHCLPGPYALTSNANIDILTSPGPPSGWMRGEGSIAAVALRERALGRGVGRRRELLRAGSPVRACLDELGTWLAQDGHDPDASAVAIHVGLLPIPRPGDAESARGGGWPFANVSFAAGGEPGGAGPAVAAAALPNDHGEISEIRLVVDAGPILDRIGAVGHVRGGAHMGIGAALSEQIAREGGVTKSVTIRSLGTLPAAATPPVTIRMRESGTIPLCGVAEACVAPVAAAIMCAIGADRLPALDSPAAKATRRQR